MKDKISKKFLIVSTLIALSLGAIYVGLFRLQVGSMVTAEWWVRLALDYKNYYVAQVKSPKLIVLAGSNALFGIDSKQLERMVEYPVANLSVHAGLNLEFLYYQLEESIDKGDIVVMPLEYFYYYDTLEYVSDWFANNMSAWGKEDYLDKISIYSYLTLIAQTPKERVWNGLISMNNSIKIPSKDDAIKQLTELHKKPYQFRGYNHLSLTKHGDMLPANGPNDIVFSVYSKDGEGYQLDKGEKITNIFFSTFNKIQSLVKKNGARLILTWPVTIRNHKFNLENPLHQERVTNFIAELNDHNIEIKCEPGLSNMHYKFFRNSKYHLNVVGANMRTEIIGNCINDVLKDQVKPYTFESSLAKLQMLEKKYDYGPTGFESREK